MKKGFTLAEVMIVLTVIGIISAIIMPIAKQSIPDKNVMLFKKGHNTLHQVISELVNTDKYYKDGDLGIKSTGELIDSTNTGDNTYFCQTIADVLTAKKVDCNNLATHSNSNYSEVPTASYVDEEYLDLGCKEDTIAKPEIYTPDNIVYYSLAPARTFGLTKRSATTISTACIANPGHPTCTTTSEDRIFLEKNEDGLLYRYKVFCMDIDGVPAGGSKNCDDKNDICPFGYGIRADGKILNGNRVKEWLGKEFTEN